jgi:hypothetical protein
MWRCGGNTRLLRKSSRVRFLHIPAPAHLCARTCLFVLDLGVSMYNMYVFTKKYIFKYILIPYLESITQPISAYFGLDSRECRGLEY